MENEIGDIVIAYAGILAGIFLFLFVMFSKDPKIEKIPEHKPVARTVLYNRKEKTVSKTNIKFNNPLYDDTKNVLVEMGYSAKQAKDLLSDLNYSSVEEGVRAAIRKVKI